MSLLTQYLQKFTRTKLQFGAVGVATGVELLRNAKTDTELIVGAVVLVSSLLGYTVPQGFVDAAALAIAKKGNVK